MTNLVQELKSDLKETERLIERYEKTLKKLEYDLLLWDEFTKNINNKKLKK